MTDKAGIMKDRRSIALTKDTIDKLKKVAKANGVKLYQLVDGAADLIESDASTQEAVISIVKAKIEEGKKTPTLTQKVNQLPSSLRSKLKSMSPEQLAELIEKAK